MYEPTEKVSKLIFLKQRVEEFEREYAAQLSQLSGKEREIIRIGNLRLKWFDAVSKVDELDTTTFKKRIDICKKKTEFLSVSLSTDLLQLEGLQESLTLGYLVEATKTLGVTETVESRELELQNVLKLNADRWKDALMNSIARRASLSQTVSQLCEECDQIKSDFHVQSEHLVNDLHRRMQEYVKHLELELEETACKHKRITGDYLVMRHNAKVGQEVLMRHHQDASAVRIQLREKLDVLVADATEQRANLARAATAELKIYSDDIRAEVKQKEAEVDELQQKIHFYNIEKKQLRHEMKAAQKFYQQKYKELQVQRASEVTTIEGELKSLRLKVNEMEAKLIALNMSGGDVDRKESIRDTPEIIDVSRIESNTAGAGTPLRENREIIPIAGNSGLIHSGSVSATSSPPSSTSTNRQFLNWNDSTVIDRPRYSETRPRSAPSAAISNSKPKGSTIHSSRPAASRQGQIIKSNPVPQRRKPLSANSSTGRK